MTYERFERHFDPSLAIDARFDEPRLFGAVTNMSEEAKEEFNAYGSELARKIPHLRIKDLDDSAWQKILGKGYEMVEHAVADGSAKVPPWAKALDDIAAELRKAFELRRNDRGLKIYPAAGTPLEALGFAGFVAFRKIHVPFEYRRRGDPEMGFAKVVIPELPPSDVEAAKYQDIIRKAGRDIFHDILRQQQPPMKLRW